MDTQSAMKVENFSRFLKLHSDYLLEYIYTKINIRSDTYEKDIVFNETWTNLV